MSASISRRRYQPPIMYRTLPTTLSLELRMQSYDNFLNPPNFRRSFFFREPHPCVWRLLYIGDQDRICEDTYLYIVSVRTWDLNKETDKQLSSRQNLLTTQGSPDTSEDPFFWVASAKVLQLSESAKFSEKFFFREPHPCVWHLLYIGVPRSHSQGHPLYIGVPRSHLQEYLLETVDFCKSL